MIAGLGLLVYAVFFLALIKLIPITLTLPGIAGLILTIGVAADSNIVIFERIKEEVRAGRSMLSAISEGYKKGIATIIDANVITLITAFILFVLASAGVKGFAFTLGIGTIVSLFTAVLFTQAVLGRARPLADPALAELPRRRRRGPPVEASTSPAPRSGSSRSPGVILAIGAIAFATKQLNLGIDFESGTRIQAALAEQASVDEIRDALVEAGIDGADSAKIQEIENPDFGANVFQIQAKIPPEQTPEVASGARGRVRARVGRAELRLDVDRADLRRADRPLGGDRDHLQPAGDLGLRRDPVRGQVRGPGADRPRSTTS